MTGIKISALPAASASLLTDIIPVVQTGITKQENLSQVISLFNANIQLASTAQVTGLDAALLTFVPLAGGTMSGPLLLSGDPTLPLGAATKHYVDITASGFTVILSTAAATTANLNATPAGAGVGATLTNAGAQVAFAVDGYSASLNDRILVKNQTLSQHNGVYTVTTVGTGASNWVLTRATDYDQATEIKPGTLIAVNNGTANANTSWLETATVVTVDTDPISFSQFTFAPGAFFLIANNLSEGVPATMRTNLGLGTVATKTASDVAQTNAAMVKGAITSGHIAVFADTNGTVQDGGVSSLITLNTFCNGRMTLTSGVPVTTSDVTAATTVYFTPYKGNQISLFDGATTWTTIMFSETSIAVPGTTSTMYDLFAFNNAGTMNLETQTWTNDTTRAVALVLQDGVYVKNGATTRRYLGSFRTTTVNGQTEDSLIKRYIFNYYNRVSRQMKRVESTATWTYSTASYRQANGSALNQLDFVYGVVEDSISAFVLAQSLNNNTNNRTTIAGIGLDSTTVNSAILYQSATANINALANMEAEYEGQPSAGRHVLTWLEFGGGADTQTWAGSSTPGVGITIQCGIFGILFG